MHVLFATALSSLAAWHVPSVPVRAPQHDVVVKAHVEPYKVGAQFVTSITVGADGNVWFGTNDYRNENFEPFLGRLDITTKQVSAFPTQNKVVIDRVIAGPDGNIWFSYGDQSFGRLATSTLQGVITYLNLPLDMPIVGPDNEIWGCENSCSQWQAMARETTTGQYSTVAISAFGRGAMTAGPRNDFWVCTYNSLDEFSPAGQLMNAFPTADGEYCTGSEDGNATLVYGPDGNVYSTADGGFTRTTPAGKMTTLFSSHMLTELQADPIDDSIWYIGGYGRKKLDPRIHELFLATGKTVSYELHRGRHLLTMFVDHAHKSVWFSEVDNAGLFRLALPS